MLIKINPIFLWCFCIEALVVFIFYLKVVEHSSFIHFIYFQLSENPSSFLYHNLLLIWPLRSIKYFIKWIYHHYKYAYLISDQYYYISWTLSVHGLVLKINLPINMIKFEQKL